MFTEHRVQFSKTGQSASDPGKVLIDEGLCSAEIN